MLKEVLVIFLTLVVFLLVGGVLTLITLQNLNTLTHLNLYFWQTPEFPVGLLLIGAMLLGAVLVYLIAFLAAAEERRELQRLRRRVVDAEAQVQKDQIAFLPTGVHQNSQPAITQMSPTGSLLKMPGMSGPLSPRN
jgi:uncharacterized integral membrane protein